MLKIFVILIKKIDILSAIACRLTVLTGKSKYRIHPKHLVAEKLWIEKMLNKKDVVLDLGSGTGQTSLKIAYRTKKVVGLEIDLKLLEIAKQSALSKKIKNISFIKGDANERLPFKSNTFDKVLCSDVLEHLNKREEAVKEIYRVLKKPGIAFFVTDNPNTSWKNLQKSVGLFYYADLDHKYEYPKMEILRLLEENNFMIETIQTTTYDTPLRGLIDLTGGLSLSLYKKLRKWRQQMNEKYPNETTGYRIVAIKK